MRLFVRIGEGRKSNGPVRSGGRKPRSIQIDLRGMFFVVVVRRIRVARRAVQQCNKGPMAKIDGVCVTVPFVMIVTAVRRAGRTCS